MCRTAFLIPYRLYLSLLYGEKPVVTAPFTIEAFEVMRDLQLAVRGSREALAEKPLAIFSLLPDLAISGATSRAKNVVDCARAMIPVEFVSMPLSGFMAAGDARGIGGRARAPKR